MDATIGLGEEQGRAVVTLKQMEHHCPEGRNDKQRMAAVFETQFIERLKQVTLAPPVPVAGAEPAPSPTPPAGTGGTIYFVSVGEVPGVDVEKVAAHFRRKYGVTVRVLPKLEITDDLRLPDFPNSRPVASEIIDAAARQHPKIMESRNDLLIGITEDMNAQDDTRIYSHSYDLWGHFALVAVEALRPSTYCEPENHELLEARLRKAVARHIGALYFDLPKSNDAQSVLYSNVGCVDELDHQGEDF